jgi:PIN domain nuclease of toxin-antitoxin system
MILLDTHVLIWLVSAPEKLSVSARESIEKANAADEKLAISAVTLWEIAQQVQRKRVFLRSSIQSFLEDMEETYSIRAITGTIAWIASELPEPFPKDPMDRLIVATAMVDHLPLVTADRLIHQARPCKLIW